MFDQRTGELTQAGQLLQQRAVKVVRLADEAEAVVRQLRQPVRKTVTIGANEPSVQALLPIIAECCQRETDIGFDVRRTQARRVGAEVLAGTLDFGVLVSQDVALGLQTGTIGLDELEVLLYPSHPLAGRERITMEEFHQQKTVTIGANEPSVQALLPIIAECCQRETDIGFDVRRTQARRVGAEVLAGTLDFGVLVSQDVALGLQTGTIGLDELEVLLYPSHPLAGRERITMEEFHQQIIVVHNDASPARDRLLRLFADHQLSITTAIISLPSLDAIKQAVEMQLGVTLLPRRAAVRELAERRLVAVPLGDVSQPRALRTCRPARRRIVAVGPDGPGRGGRDCPTHDRDRPEALGRRESGQNLSIEIAGLDPVDCASPPEMVKKVRIGRSRSRYLAPIPNLVLDSCLKPSSFLAVRTPTGRFLGGLKDFTRTPIGRPRRPRGGPPCRDRPGDSRGVHRRQRNLGGRGTGAGAPGGAGRRAYRTRSLR